MTNAMKEIHFYLDGIGIQTKMTDSGMILVNRDDMISVYLSENIPEVEGGSYDLCKKDIESICDCRIIWSKLDDDYYLITRTLKENEAFL